MKIKNLKWYRDGSQYLANYIGEKYSIDKFTKEQQYRLMLGCAVLGEYNALKDAKTDANKHHKEIIKKWLKKSKSDDTAIVIYKKQLEAEIKELKEQLFQAELTINNMILGKPNAD